VFDACRSLEDALEPRGQNRQGVGREQKTIRLVAVQDFLEPVVNLLALVLVEGAPSLFQQVVEFRAFVVHEVQSPGHGLGRMPDVVNIRVLGDGPAQDHGVEAALVHEFL